MKKLFLLLLLLPALLWAEPKGDTMEEGPSPKVKEILGKMMEANGSKVAEAKLKSLKVSHQIEMTGMGMKMKLDMYSTPESGMLVTEMNGMEMARQGYDGKEAWSKDMMMGLRMLEGQEKHSLQQMTLPGNYNPLYLYKNIVIGKETDFQGKKVVELIGKKEGLPDNHYFVDAESWLIIGNKTLQSGPQGEMPALMTVDKYETFKKSGFKYPSTISIHAGPMKMTMKTTSYEENFDMKDVKFSKPE